MLNRFTASARQVITAAQAQRRRLRHDFIGTEHLLLGLLDDETGPVAALLRDAGLDAERTRAEVAGMERRELGETDAEALRSIGIDLDAVRASVEGSFGEGALEVTPEHILLGLLRGGEGLAAAILVRAGLDLAELRRRTIHSLGAVA